MTTFWRTFHHDGKISLPSIATPPISPLPYMYYVVKSIKGNGLADRKFFKIRFWQCGTVLTLIAKQIFIFAGIRQERVVGFVDSLRTIKQTKNRVRITYEGSEAG